MNQSTVDGVTFVIQIHGVGATAIDNLIQSINNAKALQIINSSVQVLASVMPGSSAVVGNAIALAMSGIVVTCAIWQYLYEQVDAESNTQMAKGKLRTHDQLRTYCIGPAANQTLWRQAA